MKYLMDTHIMLWAVLNPDNLTAKTKAILNSENNQIYYSLISINMGNINQAKEEVRANNRFDL